MPRRNRRTQHKRAVITMFDETEQLTPNQMAERLIERGLATHAASEQRGDFRNNTATTERHPE